MFPEWLRCTCTGIRNSCPRHPLLHLAVRTLCPKSSEYIAEKFVTYNVSLKLYATKKFVNYFLRICKQSHLFHKQFTVLSISRQTWCQSPPYCRQIIFPDEQSISSSLRIEPFTVLFWALYSRRYGNSSKVGKSKRRHSKTGFSDKHNFQYIFRACLKNILPRRIYDRCRVVWYWRRVDIWQVQSGVV